MSSVFNLYDLSNLRCCGVPRWCEQTLCGCWIVVTDSVWVLDHSFLGHVKHTVKNATRPFEE